MVFVTCFRSDVMQSNFLRELCNAMMKSQRKVIAEQTAMVLSKT